MSCDDVPIEFVPSVTLPRTGTTFEGCLLSSFWPTNTACSTSEAAPPHEQCPSACAVAAPIPTDARRVRRALHTLSDDEWQRVVDAFWVMRSTETTAGQALYGPSYRGWDYWTRLHIAANNPPYDARRACMPAGATTSDGGVADGCPHNAASAQYGEDVTGGGQQQLIWHSLITFQFETVLLAVDPAIGALPYLDWAASAADGARDLFARAGEPTCSEASASSSSSSSTVAEGSSMPTYCVLDQGPWANWPVLQSWDLAGYFGSNPGSASDAAAFGAAFDAPFPVTMGSDCDDEAISDAPNRACPGALLLRNNPAAEPASFRGSAEFGANVSAAFEYCVKSGAGGDGGRDSSASSPSSAAATEAAAATTAATAASWRFSEMAACYEGRLVAQWTSDDFSGLHGFMHGWLGGHMHGGWAFMDPMGWFHHAGGDRLMREWQQRNPQLRHAAFGYPVAPAYNVTPIGLYDCSGCSAYGLGFTLGLGDDGDDGTSDTSSVVDFVGNLTAADVLCGEMANLYTYDTIVARHLAGEITAQRVAWRTELAFVFGASIGVAGVAVCALLRRRRERMRFWRMQDEGRDVGSGGGRG